MAQDIIYRQPHYIDVHLTSTAEPIQKFIDELMDEISTIKPIQSRRRSREALKKIVLNLIHAVHTSGCVQYSRDKNDYGHHRRYGRLWFKYDRLIPVIDGLIELGYAECLNGCWDKKTKKGLQSKIWASSKFNEKLNGFLNGSSIKFIDREAPEQLIQLKDNDKALIQYGETKAITRKRNNLKQYNKFINDQFITVELPEAVWVENRFWAETLLQGLLNGKFTLNSLTLNREILLEKIYRNADAIRSSFIKDSSTLSSTITSLPFSTSTSTLSTLSSTLTSHIELLMVLSSTQEKRRRELIDVPLMIQNEQLLDYLLNWLIFFNKDIKGIRNRKQRKKVHKILRSLGDIGIRDFSFRLKYECLYRVFNRASKMFDKGGRFYGASHLEIPRHLRGFIHINGEPVVEWDYDYLHVKMLYNLQGLDITEDPYDMIPGSEDRKIKKMVLLTAINAKTDKKAIKAIRKSLVNKGFKGDPVKDVALINLLDRAKDTHPLIADDIASDKGVALQAIDSKIADAILTNFMNQGIPALPVHDSFIVPEQFEAELKQQMQKQYEKVLGFTPGITKKEKKYSRD